MDWYFGSEEVNSMNVTSLAFVPVLEIKRPKMMTTNPTRDFVNDDTLLIAKVLQREESFQIDSVRLTSVQSSARAFSSSLGADKT